MTLFLNINILFQLLEIQQNYHRKSLEEIEKILPKMKDTLGKYRYVWIVECWYTMNLNVTITRAISPYHH